MTSGVWRHDGAIVDPDPADTARRRLLARATGAAAATGLLAAAYPFWATLAPSARTLAEGGPVTVSIAGLAAGEQRTVAWRGRCGSCDATPR
jgi:ubiquinol-cytochrome c reductase iron-sulfur subunit